MEKIILKVEGMSCEHCVKAVKNAANALKGVANVSVSLGEKTATVEYDREVVGLDQIKAVIEEEGYEVVG